ncbi:hypothetical protein IKE71_01720 [Candidatus Saccharibacteria bacterium]|nr:hypothetical protein [Candidatus Saccharibacteria bacterium]
MDFRTPLKIADYPYVPDMKDLLLEYADVASVAVKSGGFHFTRSALPASDSKAHSCHGENANFVFKTGYQNVDTPSLIVAFRKPAPYASIGSHPLEERGSLSSDCYDFGGYLLSSPAWIRMIRSCNYYFEENFTKEAFSYHDGYGIRLKGIHFGKHRAKASYDAIVFEETLRPEDASEILVEYDYCSDGEYGFRNDGLVTLQFNDSNLIHGTGADFAGHDGFFMIFPITSLPVFDAVNYTKTREYRVSLVPQPETDRGIYQAIYDKIIFYETYSCLEQRGDEEREKHEKVNLAMSYAKNREQFIRLVNERFPDIKDYFKFSDTTFVFQYRAYNYDLDLLSETNAFMEKIERLRQDIETTSAFNRVESAIKDYLSSNHYTDAREILVEHGIYTQTRTYRMYTGTGKNEIVVEVSLKTSRHYLLPSPSIAKCFRVCHGGDSIIIRGENHVDFVENLKKTMDYLVKFYLKFDSAKAALADECSSLN